MKIYINNYRGHWVSPHTILGYIFFWRTFDEIMDDPSSDRWVKLLIPLSDMIRGVLDFLHPKIDYVKIDSWDTWSMDSTLSLLVVPMLKQLKSTAHGAPCVDDKDVPVELRSTSAPPKKEEYDTDEYHFKRWDWALDEMIWAFEQKCTDWESQYYSGYCDMQFEPEQNGMSRMVKGPKDTAKIDFVGMKKHQKRMSNGFRLFGKYYENLWD